MLKLLRFVALIITAGIQLASAGAFANAIGMFEGTVSEIQKWDGTVFGDLEADLAADAGSPFNLGTLFNGEFEYMLGLPDSDASADKGKYDSAVTSFSLSGGSLVESAAAGDVEIWDNLPVAGGRFRDRFRVYSSAFNLPNYTINGNNWVMLAAALVLAETGPTPPAELGSDALPATVPDSTGWQYARLVITFALDGVRNSGHSVVIGARNAPLLLADTSTAVPAPASLLLVLAGLLGMRHQLRRRL